MGRYKIEVVSDATATAAALVDAARKAIATASSSIMLGFQNSRGVHGTCRLKI
jgi:hypothetical protein